MIYSTERPIERRDILSLYSIPGTKRIVHIPAEKAGTKVKEPFVSIDIKRSQISFYTNAIKSLGVKVGDKVGFTQIEELLFIHKSETGNTIHSKADGGLRLTHRPFVSYIIKHFGIRKTIKCELKETKNTFQGQQMYQLIMPNYYGKLYKTIKQSL